MDSLLQDLISTQITHMRESAFRSICDVTLEHLMENQAFLMVFFDTPLVAVSFFFKGFLKRSLETKFGSFLEKISLTVGETVYNDAIRKHGGKGYDIDLFIRDKRLLISVKSSTRWGNSQSAGQQGKQFNDAKGVIRATDKITEIISVMGICCEDKETSFKINYADVQLCGNNYWYLLSHDWNFFPEFMTLLHYEAAKFELEFHKQILKKLELFKEQLSSNYNLPREKTLSDLLSEISFGGECSDSWVNNLIAQKKGLL